jgi:hypothetical protein
MPEMINKWINIEVHICFLIIYAKTNDCSTQKWHFKWEFIMHIEVKLLTIGQKSKCVNEITLM